MNFYTKQAISLFLINVFILGILYLIVTYSSYQSFYAIEAIALFFFISTLGVVSLLKLVRQFAADKVGFAFMGLILLKSLASFLFLLPGFLSDIKPDFISILFFFFPYFIFLTYEAVVAIKILRS